jgi:outer membrane protein, heavy metal efflux system
MGLIAIITAGCRSNGEGLAAGDIAAVTADVASRTGTAPAAPGQDADAQSMCRALLASPLTEDRAVKIALLLNPAVWGAYERLGIARADLLQAGLVSNPVFSASAKFFSPGGPEVELGLAQSFVDIFFIPLRRRVAADDLCAVQAEVARELVRLVFDVRREFVLLRGAMDVANVRREGLVAVTAARDLMRKLHEAGNVRDADLTVEEVGAARLQMAVDAADMHARDARERLNVRMGLCSSDLAWSIEGSLPGLPASSIVGSVEEAALCASLDLLEEKARVHSALASSGLAGREGILPQLDLGAVGKREAADGEWGFGPQVSTAIPIFDHGQARVLAASARGRRHAARHAELTIEVSAAARRLLDRVRTLRARELYVRETYLPLRSRLVNQTVQTFNAMQIGAFDVLDAKEAEVDARREHAQTLEAAWLARLDLAELLAGSLNRDRVEASSLPESAERPTPPKGH